MFVTFETGVFARVRQAFDGLELAGGARLFALLLHGGFEAVQVDLNLALAADVGGEIDRKAVGVVQREEHLAIERAARRQAAERPFENFHAVLKGFAEALFFLAQYLFDAFLLRGEFRVGLAHFGHQGRHQLVEERAGLAQLVAVAQGPAHNAAQHVATALVAGNDAVDNEEAAGTDVIGNDLEGVAGKISAAGFARGCLDEALEEIDFVVGMHVLQNGGNALEPHAGIDARLGQGREIAFGVALELHEHEVPDLDIAVAVFFG